MTILDAGHPAHRTALAEGGRTVAIIGTGLNNVYPAENRGCGYDPHICPWTGIQCPS